MEPQAMDSQQRCDPPLNMRRLWQELLVATLPPTLLEGLSYAVFGLGDRRYREFNYAAAWLYCKRERRSAAEAAWKAMRLPWSSLHLPPAWPRPTAADLVAPLRSGHVGLLDDKASAQCADQRATTASCMARIMADIWAERSPNGSNFMKDALVGSRFQCSLEKGTLQLPPLQVPLILVCPGTGLSPCRALVQARHQQLMSAKSIPPRFQQGLRDLMFLGFRHQDGDFLYGTEWSTFNSWMSIHVAFSRDHEDKKDAGAMIFVCGRSHPMPSQVFDAFVEALELNGMAKDAATSRLRAMQRSSVMDGDGVTCHDHCGCGTCAFSAEDRSSTFATPGAEQRYLLTCRCLEIRRSAGAAVHRLGRGVQND
eukprot:Skav232190  [mRNA]  locus=scaffold4523:73665:81642:- [translate_table: standard]